MLLRRAVGRPSLRARAGVRPGPSFPCPSRPVPSRPAREESSPIVTAALRVGSHTCRQSMPAQSRAVPLLRSLYRATGTLCRATGEMEPGRRPPVCVRLCRNVRPVLTGERSSGYGSDVTHREALTPSAGSSARPLRLVYWALESARPTLQSRCHCAIYFNVFSMGERANWH